MASSSASGSSHSHDLTCDVCLEIYQNPKFLPCHHTFCVGCIQNLADCHRDNPTFPCPTCHKQTTLPSGGVTALQSNFYISSDDLERARNGNLFCPIHIQWELELFCVPCDQAICISCKLTDHESHETVYYDKAAELKKKELTGERSRVQNVLAGLVQRVEAVNRRRQLLQDQKAAVEVAIRARHAAVIVAADEARDKELTSLQALNDKLQGGLAADPARLQENLDEARKLDQRIEHAVNSTEGCELLTVLKDMKDIRVSEQCLAKLASLGRVDVLCSHPDLRCTITSDVTKCVRGFMGTVVEEVEENTHTDEVVAVERFRCGEENDIEVYSLCPDDVGGVVMSFARRGSREDAPSEKFDEDGKHLSTMKEAAGKVSWINTGKGDVVYLPPTRDLVFTQNKTQTPTHIRLENPLSGQADVWRVALTSRMPFTAESIYQFSINVGAHRAHDVDAREHLLAVVEEGHSPDLQRKVLIYRRSKKDAVAAYTPATAAFQPTDVCFYELGGQQVLLVADEAGDCIHVLDVHQDDGAVRFLRYLAPGCSLLVQPTTLNVDHKGRLWVACRGGSILTMEPTVCTCVY